MTPTLMINGRKVEIIGDLAEKIINDPKFRKWVQKISRRIIIESIKVETTSFTKKGLLFATLSCIAFTHDTYQSIPAKVFLRGDSVGMLIVLKEAGNPDEKWTILTKQVRFPIGKDEFIEIPAGMMDTENDFTIKAIDEIKEETGLSIDPNRHILINLGKFYSSPGGSDELIQLFAVEVVLPKEEIVTLQNTTKGNRDEDETIKLIICKLSEILKYAKEDMKSILAYYRYLVKS